MASDFAAAVVDAMRMLAADERTVFVGQSLRFDGSAIYHSLDGVPMERRIEMPIAENLQVGFCIGLSLTGKLPICIFPRMDFMLLAMDALVNHLGNLPRYGWKTKVIVRARVGQRKPLDAGPQHTRDFTDALRSMMHAAHVTRVVRAEDVMLTYAQALAADYSTVVVENPDAY